MNKSKFLTKVNPLFSEGIAHRGLHNADFTENGMNAFLNAKANNSAIELDVHLSADNQLVVCHDSDLIRTTGKPGIIEEMTSSYIKENYRLRDGETIPTLREVMDAIDEVVPIVIELKVWKNNQKKLALRVKEEMKNIKDKKNYMFISFDPRALTPLKETGIMRSLLCVADGKYKKVFGFRHLFESVDLEYKMLDRPNVKRYQKNNYVNCWTIETEEALNAVLPYCDTVTFQHLDPKLVKAKLAEKK